MSLSSPRLRLLLSLSASLCAIPAFSAPSALEVDCAQQPLQAVIDAAEAGSVLTLTGQCDGHFTIDKDLTLRGSPAVLAGTGAGTVLTLRSAGNAPKVQLTDLTIRNGGGAQGAAEATLTAGGLLLLNALAEPMLVELNRVTIADNRLPDDEEVSGAGGLATQGPVALAVREGAIVNNGIRNGNLDQFIVGGVLLGTEGDLVLFNTDLVGNFNLTDGGGSGGLDCAGHCIVLSGQIRENRSGQDSGGSGGGFTVRRGGTLLMQDVRVQDNESDWDTAAAGGGVILGQAVLRHTEIRDNRLSSSGDTQGAGGLLVSGGVLEMADSTLSGNRAPGVEHQGAAGLTADAGARVSLLRTIFRNNQASVEVTGRNAGALWLADGSQLAGREVMIRQNEGQTGGAYLGNGSRLVLIDSRVQGNLGAVAGGIWRDDAAELPGSLLLIDSRILNNDPDNCQGFTDPACR